MKRLDSRMGGKEAPAVPCRRARQVEIVARLDKTQWQKLAERLEESRFV
jgi:hypothetical protein